MHAKLHKNCALAAEHMHAAAGHHKPTSAGCDCRFQPHCVSPLHSFSAAVLFATETQQTIGEARCMLLDGHVALLKAAQ